MSEDTNHVRQSETATSAFEQINSLCDSFLKGWKKGIRPSLEAYLCKVDERAQTTLMRNLLPIEIEFRRRNDESPASKEYLRRFPQFATLIRQAFFLSTMQSVSQDSEAARILIPMFQEVAVTRLGNYELTNQLGRGAFGTVFEARHIQSNHRVALKTLTMDQDEIRSSFGDEPRKIAKAGNRLHRFKREFRALADMDHPNLVGLHNLEVDGDQWFFTMDLVEGEDFLTFVRPGNQLNEQRLRNAFRQLIQGVMALHRQHVIHRDLKPSNVLVSKDGNVVILDFGLVGEMKRVGQVESKAKFNGTPAYAAPEQLSQPGSFASDWYSIGVMLYEALSGDRPFPGNEMDVMSLKNETDPPAIKETSDLPDDLTHLCMRMLTRAESSRPDALEIAQALSLETSSEWAAKFDDSKFLIGRTAQLAVLNQALEFVKNDETAECVFISGKSGEGKTTLAEHFLDPLREDENVIVLAGRCYDRESVPFKALDGVIDALATYWQSLELSEAAVLLPNDIAFLSHLFPVLQRVEIVSNAPRLQVATMNHQQVRHRAFAALRTLLSRMSDRAPVIIFADDLQWGDEDSAEAILEVLRQPDSPAVMFIGSYRSDELEDSRFMLAWAQHQHVNNIELKRHDIKLSPLTAQQFVELMVAKLGKDTPSIRKRAQEFAETTGGNPFLLIELIGYFDPDSDRFQALEMPELLKNKLARLPTSASRLLEVIAVGGKALRLSDASRAAGQETPDIATVNQMRKVNLVRLIEHDDHSMADTYHDKIRESVLGQLDQSQLARIHRSIGESIEHSFDRSATDILSAIETGHSSAGEGISLAQASDLAYHFDAAGNRRRARLYALLAAEQARAQFALNVAIEKYTVVERNSKSASDKIKYRLAMGLGEALFRAGLYDAANDTLTTAGELTDDLLEQCSVEALKADIIYRQKSLIDSIDAYEKVLRRLGVWVPRSRIGLGVALFKESSLRLCRCLVPNWLYKGRKKPDRRGIFKVEIIAFMTYPYYFRNKLLSVWAAMASINRGERYSSTPILSSCHEQYANICIMAFGLVSLGEKHYDLALKIADDFDDLAQQANVKRLRGLARLSLGEFQSAADSLQDAADLFESTAADSARWTYSRYWLACAQFYLGNLKAAERLGKEVFEVSLQLGQDRMAHQGLEIWTRAVGGNLAFEDWKNCFQPCLDDYASTVQLLAAEAHWHLYHKRTAEALEIAEQSVSILKRSILNQNNAFAVSTLARTLREHAATLGDGDSQERDRLIQRAKRIARWGMRRVPRLEYAPCLREFSLALEASGHTKTALKFANQSCEVAQRQQAKYELAQSQCVAARQAAKLGQPGAKPRLDDAEKALREFTEIIETRNDNSGASNGRPQ